MTQPEENQPKFRKKDEYWSWFAWMVYLLISVDLLMTSLAIDVRGIGGELNPFIIDMFQSGVEFVILGHLSVLIFSSVCFLIMLEAFDRSPGIVSDSSDYIREHPAIALDVWIGTIFALGIALFTNNLLVIIGKPSLIESFAYFIQLL